MGEKTTGCLEMIVILLALILGINGEWVLAVIGGQSIVNDAKCAG